MRKNRKRRPMLSAILAWTAVVSIGTADAKSISIEPDEQLVFFSSAAKVSNDGSKWIIPVRGRVYEPEGHSSIRAQFGRIVREATGISKEGPENAVLHDRLRHFLGDNEGGKTVSIALGQKSFKIGKSDGDGIFQGSIELSREDAAELAPKGILSFAHHTEGAVSRTFSGEAVLTAPQGLSVISDIDDTVKITNVRDQKETLANTFFRPFREVPGMSSLYQKIAANRSDARFHFVSGSPWQLYEPLRQLFRDSGFPDASFHLKDVSLDGTSLSNLFMDPMEFKIPTITALFERYPGRKFLLVGDSGKKDPEVYAEIIRKYPGRVLGIFIRDVTDESASGARYQKLFAGISQEKWRIFKDPQELQEITDVMLAKASDSDCATCTQPQRRPANPVKPILDVIEDIAP